MEQPAMKTPSRRTPRHIIQRADQASYGLGDPSWWLTATKNTQNRKCKEYLKWI